VMDREIHWNCIAQVDEPKGREGLPAGAALNSVLSIQTH
jgi:hypothetical protein